jgi:hypothetical protein
MIYDRLYGLVEVDPSSIQADDNGDPIPQELELMRVGDWKNSNKGPFQITADDIKEYAQNGNSGVRKDVPIDVEHRTDPVFGKRAVGWLKAGEFRASDDGKLFGMADWTKTRRLTLLKEKAFKYFSPEFAHRGYRDPEGKLSVNRNVLVGGALTNRPLFKDLTAVMADDGQIVMYAHEGESMTLDEIRKKAVADLTADDKKTLSDNKDKLSDAELTAYGLKEAAKPVVTPPIGADPTVVKPVEKPVTAKPVAVKANDDGTVVISADDLEALKLQAERGDKAFERMQLMKASETVEKWISASDEGSKFKPGGKNKIIEFYNGLTEAQQAVFASDIVGNIQTTNLVGGSVGEETVEIAAADQAADALEAKATAILASDEGKGMKYSDALRLARDQNPDLASAYKNGNKVEVK